jgi:hypothetical protein
MMWKSLATAARNADRNVQQTFKDMTPQEEMLSCIMTAVTATGDPVDTPARRKIVASLRSEIADAIQPFAAGKWVSVDERLPEKTGDYYVAWLDGETDSALYNAENMYWVLENITHWLDISLPEIL